VLAVSYKTLIRKYQATPKAPPESINDITEEEEREEKEKEEKEKEKRGRKRGRRGEDP
jgi:hypothetical protein